MIALIVRAAGTNCDAELVRAFRLADAEPRLVHLDRVIREPHLIRDADLVAFPGGFSYGDDIAAGRVFSVRVRDRLFPALRDAAHAGTPMIGVCNGFQVLVQSGLLPGFSTDDPAPPRPTVALATNDSGRFIDRWFAMSVPEDTRCIWTRHLAHTHFELPIAHGEGRFVAAPDTLRQIEEAGCVAIRYAEPANGSMNDIAGICDPTGRIFGLMPHPERFLHWNRNPAWTRLRTRNDPRLEQPTPGLSIFTAAVASLSQVRVES